MHPASVRVRFTSLLLVGASGLLAFLISPAAHPMSPPVVQTWYVRSAATGSNNGSSWTDAYTHFEDALAAASAGDQVWVAEGTYGPAFNSTTHTYTFYVNKSLRIYGAFNGTEASVAARQGSAALTILDGDLGGGAHAPHVVTIDQVPGSLGIPGVLLDSFTVRNGKQLTGYGGGVYCDSSDLQLVGCLIHDNTAGYGGGLSYSVSTGAAQYRTLFIESCEFRDNSAAVNGGAVFGESCYGDVLNCQFMQNTAEVHGGGVFLWNMSPSLSPLAFANCVFWANGALNSTATTSLGGAVHLGESGSGSTQHAKGNFINCTFSDNYADGCQPGQALFVSTYSTGVVKNSILAFNGGVSCSSIHPIGGGPTVDFTDLWWGASSTAWSGTGNRAVDPLFRSHAGGGLTLKAGSLCIDAADYGQLPSDTYDLDGDSNTTEALPIDLIGGNRFVDRVETNTGAPSGQDYLDMGAYEKP